MLLEPPKGESRIDQIRICAAQPHYWYFRRSMGQPAIVNLAYGLLAGSLAALTSGLVYSGDCGWDWQRMPATADEFLSTYFVPALAIEERYRDWAERCILHVAQELQDNS